MAIVDTIWAKRGVMLEDLDVASPFELRFVACRRVLISNEGMRDRLTDPVGPWGLCEIAGLSVEAGEPGWALFRFLWDQWRCVEIECKGLSIRPINVTPEVLAW